jgi:hypothetical protein
MTNTYGYNSYYSVDNQIFKNKTLALLHANEKRLDISDVKWHFHDQEFNSVNWTEEPALSINELYAMRARQIREKYDYVIVMCSGGPDSTNVVYSFLENGIHIDEIIASAPLSGLRDWQDNSNDKSAENTISETRLAQIPFLQEVEQKYPRIKITLNDYFESILEYQDTEWLVRSTDYVHPTTVARYDIEKFPHLQAMAETGKRIGVVYGIDKPNLTIKDNKIYNTIIDYCVNIPIDFAMFENFHIELFYYSHELPELIVKQCHQLIRWLRLTENKQALYYTSINGNPMPNKFWHGGLYQRAIVPCIYPMIKQEIWQAGKHYSNIMAEMDHWFYDKHKSEKVYDMMTSNVNSTLNKLHPFYFQYKEYYDQGKLKRFRSGLKGFFKTYYIGELNEVDKIII